MSLILVVEDEHNLRIALERILKDAGYEVVQTESGKEALRLRQKTSFDLVITDLAMPDMEVSLATNKSIRPSLLISVATTPSALPSDSEIPLDLLTLVKVPSPLL
jgi:CheY-like chemotaxis protein